MKLKMHDIEFFINESEKSTIELEKKEQSIDCEYNDNIQEILLTETTILLK